MDIKIKILTFKLEHYSLVDNYRGLNIVCGEVAGEGWVLGEGYFG